MFYDGERADVPEFIVVDWSLCYQRSATATGRDLNPEEIFTVDDTVMPCRMEIAF